MSRYSPQVLRQRGITLPEVVQTGVDAFRAQRDRGRKQEMDAKQEERAAGRYQLDVNQDGRAARGDAREQGRFDAQQEEATYQRTTVRPFQEADRKVDFMNAGGMAPGETGGVEVAPGLRIDPTKIARARGEAAVTAGAAKDAADRAQDAAEMRNRLQIAREGDRTQVEVARIQASRPSGNQYNFGGGGSTMTPEERAEFVANDRNLKVLGGQTGRAARQVETGLKVGFASPADSSQQVDRYRRLTRDEDRITARQDSLAAGLRRPGTTGAPSAAAPVMPFISNERRQQGATDLDYATRVTAWREQQVANLDAIKADLMAKGQFNAAARASYELRKREARSRPPPER